MPIIVFKRSDCASHAQGNIRHCAPTAVEVTPIAGDVLRQIVGPSGGYLTRQHVPVLERLAHSQVRDADLRLVADFIETHESVYLQLL
jgi:hypothetical protein